MLSLSKNEKLSLPSVVSPRHRTPGENLFSKDSIRCFCQLSLLTGQLGQLIRIDPFGILRCELSLKVLAHLHATFLCRAAQVSKRWKTLADDGDDLWRRIREQHIEQSASSVAGTAYS
jgi:hypothetical protein